MQGRKLRSAVVGAGIAGISAAHHLQDFAEVTLFEREKVIGGHANTVTVRDTMDQELHVDTGFIVYNDRNYPGICTFFSDLGIEPVSTDMSFSYINGDSGLAYSGTLTGLFRNLYDLFNVPRLLFFKDIVKYSKYLRQNSEAYLGSGVSITEVLLNAGCPKDVVLNYFVPLTCAIWSCTDKDAYDVPADAFTTFFENHGLFSLFDRPNWFSISGGSRTYLDIFEEKFKGVVNVGSEIEYIKQQETGYELKTSKGFSQTFDNIIFAGHSNESLNILLRSENPDPSIIDTLNSYRYVENQAVLHDDVSFLPSDKRLWASWNVQSVGSSADDYVSQTTYHMNRLQKLETTKELMVTINPLKEPDPENILYQTQYSHPVLSTRKQDIERKFQILNKGPGVYFCGAYIGYGFHEDGYQSGMRVANLIKHQGN